jgi:hypothetical protein
VLRHSPNNLKNFSSFETGCEGRTSKRTLLAPCIDTSPTTCATRSWWYPPGTHPRSLRPAIVETVEHVWEQWSPEVVKYDHAGNKDESNDNNWQVYASLLSVLFGFSFSSSKPPQPCFGLLPWVLRDDRTRAKAPSESNDRSGVSSMAPFTQATETAQRPPQGRELRAVWWHVATAL